MLLQKAVDESLHLRQTYVKGAYLNALIDKEIFVQQPPGYECADSSGTRLTCRLKKSLCGLKQSGRNWHKTLTDFLKSKAFTAIQIVSTQLLCPCVYIRGSTLNDELMIMDARSAMRPCYILPMFFYIFLWPP